MIVSHPTATKALGYVSMTHDLDAVLAQAVAWKRAGLGVALATVVRTWGSSPRPAGSKLAVNERGEFVGSVSGGCIEARGDRGSARSHARRARPRVIDYGVSDEAAWEVGLACGGKVEILIEDLARMKLALLEELRAARAAKRPGRARDLARRQRSAPRRHHRRSRRDRPRSAAHGSRDRRRRASSSSPTIRRCG